MNTTHNTKTKRLIAALGVAAAAAVAPALLFAVAGTAHLTHRQSMTALQSMTAPLRP